MFEHKDMEEAKTGRATIKDVEPEALEALVKFAQTDEIEDKDLNVDLLAASDKYHIRALFNKCEAKLIKALSVDNAADYFLVAYLHEANKLKIVAKKFITENVDAVEKTEGMTLIRDHYPKALWELWKFACKV